MPNPGSSGLVEVVVRVVERVWSVRSGNREEGESGMGKFASRAGWAAQLDMWDRNFCGCWVLLFALEALLPVAVSNRLRVGCLAG